MQRRIAILCLLVVAIVSMPSPATHVAAQDAPPMSFAPSATPGDLEISNLRINPASPHVGQSVSIYFELTNRTGQTISIARLGIGLRGPDACKYANPWTAPTPFDPGNWQNVSVSPYSTASFSKTLNDRFTAPGIYILEPVYDAGNGQYPAFKNSHPLWPEVLDSGGNRVTPACLVVEQQLIVSPTPTIHNGVVWAAFTLRNRSNRTITLSRLLAAGRWSTDLQKLDWSSPGQADFPAASSGPITLTPGQSYDYLVSTSFPDQGYYFAEPWRQEAGDAGKYYTGGIPQGNRINYMVGECAIQGVPAYLQGQPSTPTSLPNPIWADDPYGWPTSRTMGWYGCHTTSASMILSYYAQKWGLYFPTDPRALNNWLRSFQGYDKENGPNPVYVAQYARGHGVPLSVGPIAAGALDQFLCAGKPAILHVKNQSHFVVAVGKMHVEGIDTYIINDPIYGLTTLRDHSEYGNTYQSAVYYDSDAGGFLQIGAYSPVQLLVTDPQGRKAGYDPRTGVTWNQIPNATYTTQEIKGPDGSSLGQSKLLLVGNPAVGDFQVEAIGTGSGSYTIQAASLNSAGEGIERQFSGYTTAGHTDRWSVTYVDKSAIYLPILSKQLPPAPVPTVRLEPVSGKLGDWFTIYGSNFIPGEVVNQYTIAPNSQVLYDPRDHVVDANGEYRSAVSITSGPYGTYTLYAYGQTSQQTAKSAFYLYAGSWIRPQEQEDNPTVGWR